MKTHLFSALLAFLCLSPMVCMSQTEVPLPAPAFPKTMSVADAFQSRRSSRDYSNPQAIPDSVLSNLLWAACGVNSPDGKITAPSAINRQDIRVYVCRADGAFLYQAQRHSLLRVSDKDLRQAVAGRQAFAASAPVCLVLASDQSRFEHNAEQMGTIDVGYVSQNICLACTALGLKTVPRMSMDKASLCESLQLPEHMLLLLNHPVGY